MAVGRSTEGLQLYFKLSCGRHYLLRTPHAVRDHTKLLCAWCEPPSALAAARVRAPTALEREMHGALEAASLGEVCVRETRLPFWHGQVDFYFPSPQLLLQVDGPRHFAAQPRVPPPQQQATTDRLMCEAAWAAGAGLVRVHHLQVGTRAATADVQLALALKHAYPSAPLLVLTAGFAPAAGERVAGQRDAAAFVAALQGALQTPPILLKSGGLLFHAPHSP